MGSVLHALRLRVLALTLLAALAGLTPWLVPAVLASAATSLSSAPPTRMERSQVGDIRRQARSSVLRTVRVSLPIRANLVGGSWRGQGEVLLRARGADGDWSRWVPLEAERAEGPDSTSIEARRTAGRTVATMPIWVGDATAVELRVATGGGVSDLELISLNTTGTARWSDRAATRIRSTAARVLGTAPDASTASATPSKPTIITRTSWGADESIRRASPTYAPTLKGAVIHHTVNSNSYSAGQSAALVRGIYSYHVRGNGWNDIGYNFVVDRFGRVYEGRYGGVDRPVIGAHSMGFNTSTSGIAYLGTHSSSTPSSAARTSVARLLSWRLDVAHVDPTASTSLLSYGNPRHPAGTTVSGRVVAGHRDWYPTDCPGSAAWSGLGSLRSSSWAQGGAKIARLVQTPHVGATGLATGLDVSARGNGLQDWTLEVVRTSDGAPIATLTAGSRASVSFDWTGVSAVGPVQAWDVRWTLSATRAGTAQAARPIAQPLIDVPAPVTLSVSRPGTGWVTPNGDGVADALDDVAVTRGRGILRAWIVDPIDHVTVRSTVLPARTRSTGRWPLPWTGLDDAAAPLPDGSYELRVEYDDPVAGRVDPVRLLPIKVDRTITWNRLPAAITPNSDGQSDSTVTSVTGGAADLLADRRWPSPTTRVLVSALTSPAGGTATLDGTLPDGVWRVRLTAAVAAGTLDLRQTIRIDRVPPQGSARRRHASRVRIRVSEPVTAIVRVRAARSRPWRTRRLSLRRGVNVARLPSARSVMLIDQAGLRRRVPVR